MNLWYILDYMELYDGLEVIKIKGSKHVIVNCQECEYDFFKRIADYRRTKHHLCSMVCSNKSKQKYSKDKEYKCFHCGMRIRRNNINIDKIIFCSIRCGAIYNNKIRLLTPEKYYTDAWREKLSISTKAAIKRMPEKFATFLSSSGNIDSSESKKKIFSSKGERELIELIKDRFPNIKWSSGGGTNIGKDLNDNIVRKAHDLYSKELKLIIEYDGMYHFKDIYGNLSLVQFKDKLLEEYCIINGWKLIRVNEKTYHKMKWEIIDKIVDMINNIETMDQITKLYIIPEL